ncbi:MAG: response regulator, partial [Planctomycetia bacterium]|nr:response regulator [Planctomycetia bacterium]
MNYQLLIAEDDAVMSGLLAELAREEGFLIQICSDGKQAYDILINDPPAALLADVQMPGMNGIELIEEANTVCPGLPVAIITG